MVLPLTVHEIGVPRAAQLGAASLALLASYLLVRRQRHHQYRTRDMSSTETSVSVVDVSRVFQASELSQVTSSYGEANAKPQGLFIQGRHGYTHLIIDEPPSHVNPIENDKYGNCIVMAHGLGTSATAYSDLAAHMTSLGYFVVRYDYFGHGYSKFNGPDMWLEYSPDMLVDQVEDVIDYCTNNYTSHSLKMAAFVGHSTGGILAIHASARWGRAISNSTVPVRSMPRIILLSPAIWADKVRRPLLNELPYITSYHVLLYPF
jgi:pimeloyl-ACP methyl ester carboxylesterase